MELRVLSHRALDVGVHVGIAGAEVVALVDPAALVAAGDAAQLAAGDGGIAQSIGILLGGTAPGAGGVVHHGAVQPDEEGHHAAGEPGVLHGQSARPGVKVGRLHGGSGAGEPGP